MRARPTRRRVALLAWSAALLGAPMLGYAGNAGLAWLRFGRPGARQSVDPLLDRVLGVAEADVDELHQITVAAPATVALAVARDLDLQDSPLVRAIFAVRTLPARLRGEPVRAPGPHRLLDETQAIGWGVLADEPGHGIVLGAVAQPWEPRVIFRPLPPEEFAAFAAPGYAKIAWTLSADPVGAAACVFRTRTHVALTDRSARRRFRRYWALFSAGILLIRYEALRLVKAQAEERARRGAV